MFEKLVFIKGQWTFVEFEEPAPCEENVGKSKIYDKIKNAFSLAYTDDQLKISVDNIFPLLKSLGLNPQSESVVDLVREASIETFGDIEPKDFDEVVLNLVKEIDYEIWFTRLEEKKLLHRQAEAEKAKAEAERLRMQQEIEKAGFNQDMEETDEWQEWEKKRLEFEEKKQKELKEDELYDNMVMAFRFIDADDDGVISTQDLYKLMMGLGEMLTDDELFDMLNLADGDCDGKVTFEDFQNFLIPQSGDVSLITSPAATAIKQLAQTVIKTDAKDGDGKKDVAAAGGKNDADATVTTGEEQAETETGKEGEAKEGEGNEGEAKPVVVEAKKDEPEISEEEKARIQKRRQSMLYGYTSKPSTTSASSRRESVPSVSSVEDNVFTEAKPTDDEAEITPTVTVETIDESADSPKEDKEGEIKATEEATEADSEESEGILESPSAKSEGGQEGPGLLLLDAIKEVDEHSNYGATDDEDQNIDDEVDQCMNELKPESKPLSIVDNKRKLFARQGSSNSLITRNTDSFGDSGIETMDSVNCSEIVEQPDLFDVDMTDEQIAEEEKRAQTPHSMSEARASSRGASTRASSRGASSRASRGVEGEEEDEDEEDEDRIEARLVRESLSRISSTDSFSRSLGDLVSEIATDRVRNFVNEHMYVEVEGEADPEILVNRETVERLDKASVLQKAILRHSLTAPELTVFKSNTGKAKVEKPSVNGLRCSHIDIDLTCEAPPKADIKSYRQFSARVKSARTSRDAYRKEPSARTMTRKMSIIDMSDKISCDANRSTTPSSEHGRFPTRSLARPRSPLRQLSPTNKQHSPSRHGLDSTCEYCRDQSPSMPSPRMHRRRIMVSGRSKSANPLLGRGSMTPTPPPSRPQTPHLHPTTASLPYTTSKLDTDEKRQVLVSEPLANADELYPNKALLTTLHHGFKSFWPIGRKINQIQKKRPFQAFEMNSYSRAIERSQFPFKGDHSVDLKDAAPPVIKREAVRPLTVNKNIINLSMDNTDSLTKPEVRKLSLYITPSSTPRTVR